MAIAAHQAAFRHGVVEVVAELGNYLTVAGTAQSRLVRLQQSLGLRLIGPDRLMNLFTNRVRKVAVLLVIRNTNSVFTKPVCPVYLMAASAANTRMRMLGSLPVALRQGVVMATQAGRSDIFGLAMIVANNVLEEALFLFAVSNMSFARTVAALATRLVYRVVRVLHKNCVWRALVRLGCRSVAVGAVSASGVVSLIGVRPQA